MIREEYNNIPRPDESFLDLFNAHKRLVNELSYFDKKELLLALLMKRSVDGLNDRFWNGIEHIKYEKFIKEIVEE